MRERSFASIYDKIFEIAPEPLRDALEANIGFWAPEVMWYNLSVYVNKYVMPNSLDPGAIKVYAILCDCSEEEMKAKFEKDGY